MALNLKAKAKKAAELTLTKSKLLEGKDKIRLDELVAQHGKSLHIIGVDVVSVNDKDDAGNKIKKDAAVMVVAEAPTKWCFGGGSLLSIITEWLIPEEEGAEAPTIDQINEELKADPLAIELEKRTQKGDARKSFWHYDIL